MTLLTVKNLKTYFDTDAGTVKAVDGVSFSVEPGETLGIVGESGCGKSVTSLSIMGLLPRPAGRIAGGTILFDGKDLTKYSEEQMRKVRGNDISMIFQEPMTSLNPVFTIGEQIMEPLRLHQKMDNKAAFEKAVELLELVSIPSARQRMLEYPHQLSGGMRQRAMIAMALACNPALLIADEPTTALDVTVQAQILDLMNELKHKMNSAIIFITHDLGVIAQMAQKVVVMYAGKVVERAPVVPLFKDPRHPYTQGLLNSIPKLHTKSTRLDVIPGVVPSPLNFPSGCKFHNRCSQCFERCTKEEPPLYNLSDNRAVRCWLYENHSEKVGVENE
ncbi:MAG: ABC transporter ATP-binding protein [Aminobacterium sp.]|jgi:oligopeptide/dipeptide ABC transporter ATP-binding protein|uniref:ABC transporter ATP-binding protein n=1 Tax=unclassified Aminobacterium TaxID=2685012 RepID=UPI001BCCDBDD|nr:MULTISPECIES: ABC transporter ATP-binding protein [unclassified Aminobacterium]MDD2206055.1 ABC transporter ATP-binding protein [Aminobacterium sp.]MDD3425627.1 ABC transporter ATP-binding protein [Aminobacterium sp.]MDD3708054.1 ABC transporter ATP-binding protein [Aminobacterium sp.]MDD4227788.1 ABC transporter ATP-binding protein [Aminobacterium sp.]MDD4550772.1 ABC transporter ATP-binding protein [Aminobacterium sp.]